MKVFLTGGTGFIGQPLAAALLKRGWDVHALVRRPESREAQALARLGATLVQGDVIDRASLAAPMQGAGVVINNAGWYALGIGGKEAEAQMQAINVDGARHVLETALEAGVPRIAHVSSIVAWGDTGKTVRDETYTRQAPPPTPYERTKTAAHALAEALQTQGAPVVMACPGSVHGPGDHTTLGDLIRLYVRGLHPPIAMFADYGRAVVHVDDCAEGIAAVAEKGRLGESYILSGGNATYREIFSIINETPGGMRIRAYLPDFVAKPFCWAAEPVERWLGLPITFSAEMAQGATSCYFFSGAKAERELGIQCRDVRQTLLDTLAEERRRAGKRR